MEAESLGGDGVLLAVVGTGLQAGVNFGPVGLGVVGTPGAVGFHKDGGARYADYEAFHVGRGDDFVLAVGDVTEAVFGNSHAVQIVLAQHALECIAARTVKNGVGVFNGTEKEGEGNNAESVVEGRIDQVGVH